MKKLILFAIALSLCPTNIFSQETIDTTITNTAVDTLFNTIYYKDGSISKHSDLLFTFSWGYNEKLKLETKYIIISYVISKFGDEIGIKITSAKITHYYNSSNLIGQQIIAVCNLPKKNIAGVDSEVLILGAVDSTGKVVLLHPLIQVENGLAVY